MAPRNEGKQAKKRRHYKVEELTCRQMVDEMLANGHTYEAIAEAVREVGESIGKSSVARYHSAWDQVTERIAKTREQMKVLIDAVRDQPGTDLAEVANQVMMQGLLSRIARAEDDFEKLDLVDAGRLVATLERSGVQRERLKLQYDKGVTVAVETIMSELRMALADMPEVMSVLAAKLEHVKAELTAG
jgi:hypothetical protein